ncbi:histidine kinase dimerization/phospho-acceptor domain-containing protein [Hyalangium sp.]|uniref:histidine kinase dimerization/phospho-acceptor domain-containing protein n=1 Tax=Hyalangium sp. TaxID=2028555 RepID=UPI002D31B763|nr:histidine kinase dimerization/phospho-acceptor domain-containing protein [Hyalangium sp.]HYH95605.1 histidine kinase dimerization/phospho-acceptor domain-containing protein [Hyalangium sp.]
MPAVQEGADPVVGAARYVAVPPLMDSLLHDVRNPLNALSINLEVLSEKLKGETGEVPASQAKNIKAMRDQIQRVDGILRQFADFIVLRGGSAGDVGLSETTKRSLDVVAHESRRRRLKLQISIDPDLRVRLQDTTELSFFLIQALLRAFGRSEAGTEVGVAVRAEGSVAVLEVTDSAGSAPESVPDVVAALGLRCAQLGVDFQIRGGVCRFLFPRA